MNLIGRRYSDHVLFFFTMAFSKSRSVQILFSNFEFPLLTKNGVRIEVLLNATTRRDEQGNVIGKKHCIKLSYKKFDTHVLTVQFSYTKTLDRCGWNWTRCELIQIYMFN